jgi:hypothetical protein
MQYTLLLVVALIAASVVGYQYWKGRRSLAAMSIPETDDYLQNQWSSVSDQCSYSSFREAWIKVSRSVGCRAGYILRNMPIQELSRVSTFPEIFYDDLADLLGSDGADEIRESDDIRCIACVLARQKSAHSSDLR